MYRCIMGHKDAQTEHHKRVVWEQLGLTATLGIYAAQCPWGPKSPIEEEVRENRPETGGGGREGRNTRKIYRANVTAGLFLMDKQAESRKEAHCCWRQEATWKHTAQHRGFQSTPLRKRVALQLCSCHLNVKLCWLSH